MKRSRKCVYVIILCMVMCILSACGKNSDSDKKTTETKTEIKTETKTEATTEIKTEVKTETKTELKSETEAATEATTEAATEKQEKDKTKIRIGSLKGPTSIGLAGLMSKSEKGEALEDYEFTIAAQADVITSQLVSGDLDIALIPANVSSILYNKTSGKVKVIDINTLGVLYCVSGDESIKSVEDLAGKTVISMGQGTTPEFMLRYLLNAAGISDCNIEFVSEATEAAALLAEKPEGIAVLPQPFVTAALKKNDKLGVSFSLTDEWNRLSGGNSLVTGVTVVRADFLADHEDAVKTFMQEQKESTEMITSDLSGVAEVVVAKEIIDNQAIAEAAIPNCNITYVDGEEMKKNVSEYLKALYDLSPESVGKKLPEDDFYYTGK